MPGGKLLVLDGNHQVAASLLAGAQSVPVDVVADLSDLDTDAFFDEAAQKGWTYLNDFGGRSTSVVPSYAERSRVRPSILWSSFWPIFYIARPTTM